MPRFSRRIVLAATGLGLGGVVAGYLGTGSRIDPEDHVPDGWHDEPVRGRAEPVETKAAIDDEVTYHPEREEVEISEGEFRSVEHWLEVECPHVAGRYLADLLNERLDDSTSVGAGIVSSGKLFVRRYVEANRDGDIISSPTVEFKAILDATPKYVDATVTLDDFEHTCRPPVYVEDTFQQEE